MLKTVRRNLKRVHDLTVCEFYREVAKLGGFLGRKPDGEPGSGEVGKTQQLRPRSTTRTPFSIHEMWVTTRVCAHAKFMIPT